jgi:hypothetical protein
LAAIRWLSSPKARLNELIKRKARWIGLVATVRLLRGEDKPLHATLLSVKDD